MIVALITLMLSNPDYISKSYFDDLESCQDMIERYRDIDDKNDNADYDYYCEGEEIE